MGKKIIITTEDELSYLIRKSIREAVDGILKNNPSIDPEPFVKGIHGLAKYLGISPTMAQKLKNEGIFQCFQYDKTLIFDKQKIKEALNNYKEPIY